MNQVKIINNEKYKMFLTPNISEIIQTKSTEDGSFSLLKIQTNKKHNS